MSSQFDQIFSQEKLEIDQGRKYCIFSPNSKFFDHDIKQGVDDLVSEIEKKRAHLKIGKLLLQNLKGVELEENLFEIVNHLNLAQTLMIELIEKYQLVELNLKASHQAKASSDFENALKFLKNGLNCLPVGSWEVNYPLTLDLYLELGKTEYLNCHYSAALLIFEETSNYVKNYLDQCRVNQYKIICYQLENDLISAYELGLQTLSLLGIEFSGYPSDEEVLQELIYTKELMGDRTIESLIRLPLMADPEQLMAQNILQSVWAIAGTLGSNAIYTLPMKMLQLSLIYGNSAPAAFGYMIYAFTLVCHAQDIQTGADFGQLSFQLQQILNTPELEANIFNVWGGTIFHCQEHISKCKPYLLQGFKSSVAHGVYQWAGANSANYILQCFFGNESLKDTAKIVNYFISTLKKVDKNMLIYHLICQQAIANLTKVVAQPAQLIGGWMNEHEVIRLAAKSSNYLTAFVVYVYKLSLCNWFGDHYKAVEYAACAEDFISGGEGIFIKPVFYYNQAIAIAGTYSEAPPEITVKYLNRLNQLLLKFKHWAEDCPSNYLHQSLLIQAEIARIAGQNEEAIELYQQAIADANQNQYLQNAALANELAAKFFLGIGQTKIAQSYLKEAQSSYRNWGAIAKVKHLEKQLVG